MAVRYFYEEVNFKLPHPRKTSQWIADTVKKEKGSLGDVSYVFCKDSFLLELNQKHLNHDTLTDIIAFDLSDESSEGISGEIYISLERVAENAEKYDAAFMQELHRVLIHGILHLLGYSDKTEAEKVLMRKKEEAYLSLRK
ncbi:MAG: rRNA maturation RNase YbeY [Cyclobacteriaceae bacterium]